MEVNLSSAIRTSLHSTQKVADFTERAQIRIATGKKHQSLFDNAQAVSVSNRLSDRASDLLGVKSNISQGLSKLGTAANGLQSISQLLNQMKAVAQQYEQTDQASQQANLSNQFDGLKEQLDGLARDSSFGGTNLIDGSPDTLDVTFNENGSSSVTIVGSPSDSTGLGVSLSLTSIDAALSQVRALGENLGANAGVLSLREEFTGNLVNTLEGGAAKLVETDLNEEAANILSAQTRGLLSVAATKVAAQSERAILQLF